MLTRLSGVDQAAEGAHRRRQAVTGFTDSQLIHSKAGKELLFVSWEVAGATGMEDSGEGARVPRGRLPFQTVKMVHTFLGVSTRQTTNPGRRMIIHL